MKVGKLAILASPIKTCDYTAPTHPQITLTEVLTKLSQELLP
jgi:hypothetical protein